MWKAWAPQCDGFVLLGWALVAKVYVCTRSVGLWSFRLVGMVVCESGRVMRLAILFGHGDLMDGWRSACRCLDRNARAV